MVEIVQAVLIQNIRKMASPEDDDVFEALTTNAAKIALARCIHKRSPHCRSHDFHSSTLRHLVEFSAELAVVIANDHIGTLAERRDVAKLLSRPLFRWCSRNPNVNDFAGPDINYEEGEQWPKLNIIDLQEVAGPNRIVREKRLPALPTRDFRRSGLGHVSLNCALRNSYPKFP